MIEVPVIFTVNNQQLFGIHHQSHRAAKQAVIIVVGGPQTRVGSHRQFVLLARYLARQGVHVFRFDYTGAGDSEGDLKTFTELNLDIGRAIDTLMSLCPEIEKVFLWGLCDAAAAILLYLADTKDVRVQGLILANPWVRQPASQAKTYLQGYYFKRFMQKSFWRKILLRKISLTSTLTEIKGFYRQTQIKKTGSCFVDLMYQGASEFSGNIQLLLSGNDLTADEFSVLLKSDVRWKNLLKSPSCSLNTIEKANHTFTHQLWHQELCELTLKAVSQCKD